MEMKPEALVRNVKFASPDQFHKSLRRRIERYFQYTRQSSRDCLGLYFKSAIVLSLLFGTYVLLVFVAGTLLQSIMLAALLGGTVALVGFNIQHDANHDAYSKHAWVNQIMGLSLDLVGASSYLWRYKHNSIHHTYSNIAGHDDDINLGWLGRLSPHQKRLGFHRCQHIYLWLLYGFIAIKWQLMDDFVCVARGVSGGRKCPRPRGFQFGVFWGGKLIFLTLAFVIPCLVHSPWTVLWFYLGIFWLTGILLSVVFQLAHAVESAEFPLPQLAPAHMPNSWSAHQIATTVDFARSNRCVTWLLGGLNYQLEHHLFPKICHLHYPRLSRIVKRACEKEGLRYKEHRGVWEALASHARWLKKMGQRNVSDDSATQPAYG